MLDRNAYLQKMEAQLKEWKADLDKLAARAEGATADARIELQSQVTDLRRKLDHAEERFQAIRSAGSDAFDAAREKLDTAVREFTTAFGRVRETHAGHTAGTAS